MQITPEDRKKIKYLFFERLYSLDKIERIMKKYEHAQIRTCVFELIDGDNNGQTK